MKKLYFICLTLAALSYQVPIASAQGAEAFIIETLEKETQYFCERNLEKWQEQWVYKS